MTDVWDQIARIAHNYMSSPEEDPKWDGNRTNAIIGWFFPTENFGGMQGEILAEFTERIEQGDLQWVIFPCGT